MDVKLNLFGFNQLVKKELEKNFAKAGIYFTSRMRGYLNTAQKYQREGKRFVGLNPSRPGTFPHKLTGQLQKSITWSLDKSKLVLTVGSSLKGYPKFLQSGTRLMKPRPWLTLAWAKEKDRVGKLLIGK